MAHDFNNLLTVVIGHATALRLDAEARGDTKGARHGEIIERSAERGGRLAGQLLAFARNQVLRPESISAYGALSGMYESLALASGDTVRIRLLGDNDLWDCRVDPGQFDSAILSLVLNARDAMPAGGDIILSCHNQTKDFAETRGSARSPGDYVRIDVKDFGTGIPPHLLAKVFEPFFTTKPIGKGSGLGLAQVHGFAGQSGGWAELHSQLGHGTTVSLYLPRAQDRQFDPLTQAEWPEARGSQLTVLVVEPDTDHQAMICKSLIQSGYHAIAATNASGALAFLASNKPVHLLLTEAQLPGDRVDLPGVPDVRQRVRIQYDEVRDLPWFHRAQLRGQPEEPGRLDGGGVQGLAWGGTGRHQVLELLVQGEAGDGVRRTRVGAGQDRDVVGEQFTDEPLPPRPHRGTDGENCSCPSLFSPGARRSGVTGSGSPVGKCLPRHVLLVAVMRTYEVRTYGCQMNVHDSERLAGLLEDAGYVRAPEGDQADVVVFNTCAVRENADNKLYGNLGHLAPVKAKKPDMQIAVGGCLAQKDKASIVGKAPVGRRGLRDAQHRLAAGAAGAGAGRSEESQVEILESLEVFPSTLPTRRESPYSAWVSVSVGCNNTCTFCIVPALRGRRRTAGRATSWPRSRRWSPRACSR